MSQNEIDQIEVTIEQAREAVDRGKMAEKLSNNREFKKLVLEGYFEQEAARLVHLSSDPSIREDIRNVILRDMAGPGAFKRYLSTIVQMGQQAAREIEECEQTRQEIREDEDGSYYGDEG